MIRETTAPQDIVWLKIDEVYPYECNNKIHRQPEITKIANSIKEFGWTYPILIDENNIVLAGHKRLQAAKQIGLTEVPTIRKDDLSDAQKRAYRIIDNKSSEESEYDPTNLTLELDEIKALDFDISKFITLNFDLDKIGETQDLDAQEDDYDAEPPAEPKTKYGDIYQLGSHRLMCGNSTKEEDVEKLMNGEIADLLFTDPPYGMKKENEGVLNDNLNYEDLLEFNKKWIPLTFKFTKENGSWYCWGIDEPLMDIYSEILKPMIKRKEIAFRNLITWNKGDGQGQLAEGVRMYPIADEKCLFVMCGGDSVQGFCVNADDYSENMDKVRVYLEKEIKKLNQSDKIISNALGYKDGRTVNHWWSKSQFAIPTKENYEALREYGRKILGSDFLKKDYDELKKDFYAGRSYFNNTHDNMNNVWEFKRTSQKEREDTGGHATPKPIELCARAIKSSSREEEIVLDVFGGSGSTLIACEQLDRTCYMMELDERYVQVIIDRYIKFTGKDVYRINSDGTRTNWKNIIS